MVASVGVAGNVLLAAACVAAALGSGCGGESSRSAGTAMRDGGAGAGGATMGAGASGGAGTGGVSYTDGRGGFVPAAGAGPEAIALDGPACAARRAADCEGIEGSSYYSGHGTFDASPELAACSAYVSYDGCGQLIYAFDAEGCATSLDPGPEGWKGSEHLSLLRDCLSAAFTEARFACLASRSFAFYESCYIH